MAASKGAGTIRSLPLLKTWRRYLAPSSDTFGSTMVKPGERGFGIIPWVMNLEACDCGHPNWELTHGDPVIAPAFVTWVSPLGTNDELREEIVNTYELNYLASNPQDVTTPMLHADGLLFPDKGDGHGLTLNKQGLAGWARGQDTGLIPAWAVTPISEKMYRLWSEQAKDTWSRKYPWLDIYAFLHSCDEEYFHVGSDICYDPDHPEHIPQVCQCGMEEALTELEHDAKEGLDFTDTITTERAAFEDAFETAMERVRYGWQLCFERFKEGDETSDALGSEWSPYWQVDAARAREKYKHLLPQPA